MSQSFPPPVSLSLADGIIMASTLITLLAAAIPFLFTIPISLLLITYLIQSRDKFELVESPDTPASSPPPSPASDTHCFLDDTSPFLIDD